MKVINMRMRLLVCMAVVSVLNMKAAPPPMSAEDDVSAGKEAIVIPGKGHFNVEELRNVDLGMDISNLSIAELRVVRNALAARQGHLFQSKDLRSLFSSTSWYNDLLYERYEKIEKSFVAHPVDWENASDELTVYTQQANKYVPLKYTPEEEAFVGRLKAREAELQKENFKAKPGEIVNVDNILNPWQVEEFPDDLRKALSRNGFAIVENDAIQLFHIYEENNYKVFPSFVTTDVYLQLFHFYFDCLLRDIEEEHLSKQVGELCAMIARDLDIIKQHPENRHVGEAAEWLKAYIIIGQTLLSGQLPARLPESYAEDIRAEVRKCTDGDQEVSPFLGQTDAVFPYILFRPRGHYTHSETLQRYFRAMMWLQTAPFVIEDAEQMKRAALLSYIVGGNKAIAERYQKITEPLTFLMGAPDNVDIMQVFARVKRSATTIGALIASKPAIEKLQQEMLDLAKEQIRIKPTDQVTSPNKINLMPQRYMPDAEVLQEMADTRTRPLSLRKAPKALDVMAALGVSSAERILLDELKEAERWPQYTDQLARMKQRMSEINWEGTVATSWISALKDVPTVPEKAPYFMQTHNWQKKSLNTSLASYAELKHDAILYAKQPFGAECGGGGPPEPVLKGYVEPSVAFWRKAVALNKAYADVLKKFNLTTEKTESATESIGDLAQFLLNVSEKELAGKPLSKAENDQIEIIGSTIEYISLNLVRNKDSFLDSWENVTGPDRKVACIADVYTANAFNIPDKDKCVVYEGVGPAYSIYVIVEIDGQLWLTRGAVFSYRELEGGAGGQRLTDEEWQQTLDGNPTTGTPEWMKDLVLPTKNHPKENDAIFYSSGC
ncbi:MAG: DUF3160 domain-containing protein [Bacteroidales bacterium]|nr:DUF3160 domain-containing protein [Bacteroidales bacterium]